MRNALLTLIVCLFVLSACEKDIAVHAACNGGLLNEGQECDATADCPCGSEGACVAAVCRLRCGSDADCSGGAICVKDALGRGGCLFTAEQSCSKDDPCPAPLACAIDDHCRVACSLASPCPSNDQSCLFGACYGENESGAKPWLCDGAESGDLRCRNATLEACNTTALGWSELAECATPALCEAGLALGGASCAPPACEASARDCGDRVLLQCREDRTGWDRLETCLTPGLCELARDTGSCTTPCGASVEPGEVRCRNGKLEACDNQALGWQELATCGSQELCEAGLALGGRSCVAPVCAAGARDCDGTELRRCRDDRTGFDVEDECETTGLCRQATATGQCGGPCNPGGECRGDALWLCRADGTGFDAGETCVSAAACLGGSEPRCTSDTLDRLDDFEDGNLAILGHSGRLGSWASFSDTFAAISIGIEDVTGRGDSQRGLGIEVSKGGFGATASAFLGTTGDLSEYAGVMFWAKKLNGPVRDAASPPELLLRLDDVPNIGSGSGGSCDESRDQCWQFFKAPVPVEFTWQAFGYTWSELGQDQIPYSEPSAIAPDVSALRGIGLEGRENGSYLIDDVTLLRSSVPANCTPDELLCEGPVLRRCNAQGNRHVLVDVCGTLNKCQAALGLGHCPSACAPGAGECRGKELWRCAPSGDGVEYSRTCGLWESCVPGTAPRCLSEAVITPFEATIPLLPRLQGRNGDYYPFACGGESAFAFTYGSTPTHASPWSPAATPAGVMGRASLLDYLPSVEPGIGTLFVAGGCGELPLRLQYSPRIPNMPSAVLAYDASEYRGVRFRARSRSPDGTPDRFRFYVTDRTSDSALGICGTPGAPLCYQALGKFLDGLGADWKDYEFRWSDLEPTGVPGGATTFDPHSLVTLGWQARQSQDAELELDDVEFVE